MKRSSTLFLKFVICLIAIGALAGMLWFPHTEGRAANLDFVHVYADPLIIYMYVASMPFFMGLYQAFRLLGFIDGNTAFSERAVAALKKIKYASLSLIGLIVLGLLYIRFFAHGDDPAGPTMLGIVMSLAFGVIAITAGIFQRLFQNAVDMKSENDLTV